MLRHLFSRTAPSRTLPLINIPKLSEKEQFDLLRTELKDSTTRGPMGELVMSLFGGDLSRVGLLFTISKDEYLAWARTLPITSFVSTVPHTFDGDYLVQTDAGWSYYWQERGMKCAETTFATENKAREFAYRNSSPYGIYKHLKSV